MSDNKKHETKFATAVGISFITYSMLVLILGRGVMHHVYAMGHFKFEGLCVFSGIASVCGIFINQVIGYRILLGKTILLISQCIGISIPTVFWCVYGFFFSKQTLWYRPNYPQEIDDFLMFLFCLFTLVITFGCSLILRLIQLYSDRKKKIKEQ